MNSVLRTASILSLAAAALAANAQNLYVATTNNNSGTVLSITPTGTVSTFAGGFTNPLGLASDAAGSLYLSDNTEGQILKIAADGTRSTFADSLPAVGTIALNPSGTLFGVVNNGIKRFDPNGTYTSFGSGGFVNFLTFDPAGNLYSSGSNVIYRFTPDGTRTTYATPAGTVRGLAFDASGNLFAALQDSSSIAKITPAGVMSTFATSTGGLSLPYGLAFDGAGFLYAGNLGNSNIVRFAANGTASTFATGIDGARGLAFGRTQAVPEPSALAALGLGALGLLKRRKRA